MTCRTTHFPCVHVAAQQPHKQAKSCHLSLLIMHQSHILYSSSREKVCVFVFVGGDGGILTFHLVRCGSEF